MGSSLQIISDHSLKFQSGEQTVEDFSEKLSIKVLDGDCKNLSEIPKTDKFDETKYYISYDYL